MKNIKKIQEKAKEYVKKNSKAIYSNLNVFEPVGKGYKQGYMDCLEDLEKRLELATELLKCALPYVETLAENSEMPDGMLDLVSEANRFLEEKK